MGDCSGGQPSYIWVSRWEDFQHYPPVRERGPAWIKDYTAQLDDERYLDLNDHQRAVLHDLRIVFASSRGKVSKDTRKLSNRLGLRVTKPTLEALNHAGFIEFCSREDLERRLERLYSRERSKKKSKEESKKTLAATPRARKRDPLWDVFDSVIGEVSTDSERQRRNAALKQLRAAGATGDELRRRCMAFRRLWPAITLTEMGVVSNWSKLNGNGGLHAAVSCPRCGIGLAGARALADHLSNVHEEVTAA